MTTATTTTATTATTAARRTPVVRSVDDVPTLGTVLGVWAHPDDEVYLSAGVLAAAAAGNRVVVVTATRGEHGTDDPVRWPPERLARHRAREIVDSLTALHPAIEHRFLGDRIGVCHLDGSLDPNPSSSTIDELAAIVDEVAPDTVLTFGPEGFTGHRDHRAVSAWTDHALRRAGRRHPAARVLHATTTTAWLRRFSDHARPMDGSDDAFPPCPPELLSVDLELAGAALDRKIAALRAQATQTAALEHAVGPEEYRSAVAGEYFRPAPGTGAP
jgi:LmbE family N-acetylglucosaminyl deacetylase